MSTVTPFLMFNDQLEAAAEFYTATFPDSEVREIARMGEGGPLTSAEICQLIHTNRHEFGSASSCLFRLISWMAFSPCELLVRARDLNLQPRPRARPRRSAA
ncbi:MAG: VOC family protein [Rubrivivax sp.]|nr:VOC family protein [Pyrinomonadaceae bacterium]